jgi:hypothetical protein
LRIGSGSTVLLLTRSIGGDWRNEHPLAGYVRAGCPQSRHHRPFNRTAQPQTGSYRDGFGYKHGQLYQEQLARIDRLLLIIEADDPYKYFSGLLFYDILIFTCQSMWHMKDWILNDPKFGEKDHDSLNRDIH